jgi:16S rRNA (adenine1518-N6/adenine1519-N6)-dimethyltransferase
LAAAAGKVLAVELDTGLADFLGVTFCEHIQANVLEVIRGDILKVDLLGLFAPFGHMKLKVVANLPYYITTPVVLRLLESGLPFESVIVMVQKEVARRMAAVPGTKEYGSLSLAVAYYAVPEMVAHVPVNAFFPRPEVDSAVIRLRLHRAPPVSADKEKLFMVIRAAFAQRRKTLVNALFAAGLGESKERLAEVLAACGLRADVRGEALDIYQFAQLTERVGIGS